MKPVPTTMLYKYCPLSSYSFENLRSGQIICRHYTDFNDPFEFWSRIYDGIPDAEQEPERFLTAVRAWGFDVHSLPEAKADPYLWDNVAEYFDECQHYAPPFELMRQQMRVACFGSERDSLLMWSHYADGLRGFCIVFDENSIMNAEPNGHLVDVAYLDTPPAIDGFIYGIAKDQVWYSQTAIEETSVMIEFQGKAERVADIPMYEKSGSDALIAMHEIWQHVFAVKPTKWEYERERRILVQTDRTDAEPIFLHYPSNAIKEVVLGELMPKDSRSQLIAILKQRYPEVPVKTARRATGTYTLTVD